MFLFFNPRVGLDHMAGLPPPPPALDSSSSLLAPPKRRRGYQLIGQTPVSHWATPEGGLTCGNAVGRCSHPHLLPFPARSGRGRPCLGATKRPPPPGLLTVTGAPARVPSEAPFLNADESGERGPQPGLGWSLPLQAFSAIEHWVLVPPTVMTSPLSLSGWWPLWIGPFVRNLGKDLGLREDEGGKVRMWHPSCPPTALLRCNGEMKSGMTLPEIAWKFETEPTCDRAVALGVTCEEGCALLHTGLVRMAALDPPRSRHQTWLVRWRVSPPRGAWLEASEGVRQALFRGWVTPPAWGNSRKSSLPPPREHVPSC